MFPADSYIGRPVVQPVLGSGQSDRGKTGMSISLAVLQNGASCWLRTMHLRYARLKIAASKASNIIQHSYLRGSLLAMPYALFDGIIREAGNSVIRAAREPTYYRRKAKASSDGQMPNVAAKPSHQSCK